VLSVAEMFCHVLKTQILKKKLKNEKKNAVTNLPGSSGQPKILLTGLTSQQRH
jgi:hypothetical protein